MRGDGYFPSVYIVNAPGRGGPSDAPGEEEYTFARRHRHRLVFPVRDPPAAAVGPFGALAAAPRVVVGALSRWRIGRGAILPFQPQHKHLRCANTAQNLRNTNAWKYQKLLAAVKSTPTKNKPTVEWRCNSSHGGHNKKRPTHGVHICIVMFTFYFHQQPCFVLFDPRSQPRCTLFVFMLNLHTDIHITHIHIYQSIHM